MSTAFSDARIHSFPHVSCNLVKSSCVTETVHQTKYCQFVWHKRIGKWIPKLIPSSLVRTRCQVILTVNTRCTCEKDILALRLFEDN
jgi:hypothetical protein